jgi:hypothetical protein
MRRAVLGLLPPTPFMFCRSQNRGSPQCNHKYYQTVSYYWLCRENLSSSPPNEPLPTMWQWKGGLPVILCENVRQHLSSAPFGNPESNSCAP